jgi:hypothetical protein
MPKTVQLGCNLDKHLDALSAHIAAYSDVTVEELFAPGTRERSVAVWVATMWEPLEALALFVKKTTCHAAEQEGVAVAMACTEWLKGKAA